MSSLYPFAGAHAVQTAAFGLEWPVPLDAEDIAKVGATHQSLRAALPLINPLTGLTFHMGMQGGVPQASVPVQLQEPQGYSFTRLSHQGVSRTLEVHKNRCVGQVNDYTRWKAVWGEVKKWFEAIGPILGTRQIAVVGIQYNDVFYWRDSPDAFSPEVVFNAASEYLPKNSFHTNGLWHSHHGYLTAMKDPKPHVLLENVNVNLADELGQRSISVSTVHKATLSDYVKWDDLSVFIDPLMETLHQRNKAVLRSLLSENARAMIKLDGDAK